MQSTVCTTRWLQTLPPPCSQLDGPHPFHQVINWPGRTSTFTLTVNGLLMDGSLDLWPKTKGQIFNPGIIMIP